MSNTNNDAQRLKEKENKALFRRAFNEFFIQRDFASVDRNYSPHYIQYKHMPYNFHSDIN